MSAFTLAEDAMERALHGLLLLVPPTSTCPVTPAANESTPVGSGGAATVQRYPNESPQSRQGQNSPDESKTLRLKAGAWCWPDGVTPERISDGGR